MSAKKPVTKKKKVEFKESVNHFKKHSKDHYPLLGLIALFAGFSLWGVFSFFNSTNDYLEYQKASVIASSQEIVEEGDVGYEPKQVFTDVPLTYANAEAIGRLYEEGIVSGYEDGTFVPDNTITRAEFWVIITNAIDADFGGMDLDNCFTDVKEEWYATFVCYAKEKGWVKGFLDGSYHPNDPVTKAQVMKMMMEAFGYSIPMEVEEAPYRDVSVDDWFAPYALIAKERRFVNDPNFFVPAYNMRRGDVAQVVYAAMMDLGLL